MSSVIDEARRPGIRPSTTLDPPPEAPREPDAASASSVADPRVLTAILVVASVIAGYCIHAHAMWFDEVQAWNIARASHSVGSLYTNLRYEGHPILWYLPLFAISRFTADPRAMQVFEWAVLTCTYAVILFKAPFSIGVRTAIVAGYFVTFEYGVISRSYSVEMLLLVLALVCLARPKPTWGPVGVLLVAAGVDEHGRRRARRRVRARDRLVCVERARQQAHLAMVGEAARRRRRRNGVGRDRRGHLHPSRRLPQLRPRHPERAAVELLARPVPGVAGRSVARPVPGACRHRPLEHQRARPVSPAHRGAGPPGPRGHRRDRVGASLAPVRPSTLAARCGRLPGLLVRRRAARPVPLRRRVLPPVPRVRVVCRGVTGASTRARVRQQRVASHG